MTSRSFSIVFILLFFVIPVVSADLTSLTVQGKLTNSSGDVLSGTYSLTFRIYNVTSGGSALFTQVSSVTTDARGVYSVELKDINLDFDVPYYLGVEVASDGEMTPRYNLTSSPYSFSASGLNESIELNHNVNFDSNTLFIDTTNNRIGIGTATPSQSLEVAGNVNVSGSSVLYVPQICLNGTCQTSWPSSDGASSAGGWVNNSVQTSTFLNVSVDTNVLFVDTTNNRVGIGTNTPSGLLHLNGTVGSLGNGLVFGDADTGLYENVDDNLYVGLAGNDDIYRLLPTVIRTDLDNSWSLLYGSASSTNPTIVPRANDVTTGLGSAASNKLSLIADGQQMLQADGVNNIINVYYDLNISNTTAKLYAPEICLNGVCKTSWPTPTGVSVAGGWTNNSLTTNTSLDVNVDGNIAITGSINASNVCLNGDCNTAWPTGGNVYYNKTTVTFSGNVGVNGYISANSACNSEFTGTHLCTIQEILHTINTKDVSAMTEWSGTAWIATGPPGYTANSNDCLGFTSNSVTDLGKFWNFDQTTDAGMGWMTSCSTSIPLACCSTG